MKKNYTPLKRLILFLWLSFLPIGHTQAALLNVVDQTWQVVPSDYKKYSIINGAILWELNWLYNFYRFANFHPTESRDAQGRKIIGYDPEKTDNVTKLVRILFHQIAGSTSISDFDITQNIKPDSPTAAPEIATLVAELVAGLDKLSGLKKNIDQAAETLEQEIKEFEKKATVNKRAITTARKNLTRAQKNFALTNNPQILEHAYTLLFRSAQSPFYLAGAGHQKQLQSKMPSLPIKRLN